MFALQADELPRPRADLQARPEVLSRPAAAPRRVRQGAPLRAVGRAARPDARARLHAGRRAHLLHRRADRGGVPQDQRSDPVDLQGLRLRGHRRQALDAAGKARRHRRAVGPGREAHDATCCEQIAAQSGGRIKTGDQPGRGRVLRAEVRIRAARRHRPRLAVRHHAGRLQPAGALRRVLHRRATARRRRR